MKTNYAISIPKPCHEDWTKMTPNEKGRFCGSCSKTVVDFTKMNAKEIQVYIHNHKDQRICGHIKQSQLDTINLKIPETVIQKAWSFQKLFLLTLLVVMGTTLFNCSDNRGKKQKINSIEVVETHHKSIDTILKHEKIKEVQKDSITLKGTKTSKTEITEQHPIEGVMIVETVGGIEVEPVEIDDIEPFAVDSLEIETPLLYPPPNDEVVFGLIVIENPPEFLDTPDNLSRSQKRKYLSKRIIEIVKENFNKDIVDKLDSKERERKITQFKIDEKGFVKDIKIRDSNNSLLEVEIKRVINLLPQFKPGNQRGKNIATIFTLPISFIIED